MRFNIFNRFITVFIFSVLFSGCSPYRLGDFTVASSFNVRNLNYSEPFKKKVKGKSCLTNFIFTFGAKDDRLRRAMDDAIERGQKKRIDGDLLVNVRIEVTNPPFQNCIVVTGNLVKVIKTK